MNFQTKCDTLPFLGMSGAKTLHTVECITGFVEESSSVEREGVAGEGATQRLRHVEENIV